MQSSSGSESRRFLPLLLLLFVGSGCAALIYEIVWFQLIQLVIGSSAVSLAVLLGTFMGGMCLGSLALPRAISVQRHPLRVYAGLEVAIGILGILVLLLLPPVARLYVANAGQGFAGILFRGAVCAVCLLPPTMLMGATLPAIARWIEATPRGVSWLGFFYGGNIGGAVFGCLLAGFYLLRVHDMATATYVAAAINATVALAGLGIAALARYECSQNSVMKRTQGEEAQDGKSEIRNPKSEMRESLHGAFDVSRWPVYVTIALSGLCALGAEVIWTRLLSLLLGGTVYTFSIILAVFLVGLGIGSSVGSVLARGAIRSRIALGCCQMLLATAMAWTAYMLARSLPYWPIKPSISPSPWVSFQLDLARCFWAVLPPTLLWGASFPLALAAAAAPGADPGRLVGGVYAANTVGAILGALGASLMLIPLAGTQHSQQALMGISVAAALLTLVPLVWSNQKNTSAVFNTSSDETSALKSAIRNPQSALLNRLAASLSLLGVTVLAVWLAGHVPKVPWGLVAHGRNLATQDSDGKILYLGEGINASVAVTETSGPVRNFHVSGKIEASTEPQDMRLQRMLGHIPALFHPKPRSVLIVGCGAGVTAGSFVVHPSIEKIVICEIEPLIPNVVASFFGKENYNVVTDPRVKIVYDDARHYVLTTREKFDVITSDPIHPWVKGAATLYTKEYFELCKRHLNPRGLVTQWVPLYESKLDVVKSEIATFFSVFPEGTIWSNDLGGDGYDVVLLGQGDPSKINVDELQARLDRDETVNQSLSDVGFKTALSLLATYAGYGPDLKPWLKDAEINQDRNLRLQYLAGLALNASQGGTIFDQMMVHRKFPEGLFVSSSGQRQALREALQGTNSSK